MDTVDEQAFFQAAYDGDPLVLQKFIDQGGSICCTNSSGATALHLACLYDHAECVKLLLAKGADPNAEDPDGSTPLHKASFSGSTECVQELLKWAAEQSQADIKGATPLHIAAYKGEMETAILLIDNGADVNATDNDNVRPVHHTCFQGHVSFTKLLISRGAEINVVDKGGSTPLHNACFKGHYDCAKVLIDNGANLRAVDKTTSPLHHCAFFGHFDCLKLLIENEVDLCPRDAEGSTPLHKAAFTGNAECCRLLCEKGADVLAQDEEGSAPIHQAAFSGKRECLEILIEHGADVECQDNDDGTALHNACFNGYIDCVQLLLSSQANYNVADSSGASPLHFAFLNGHKKCAALLIENGAGVSTEDEQGMTPLHQAVDHVECVEYLLDQGAEIDARDFSGKTPLFYAVENTSDAVVRLLINRGADANAQDNVGETVMDIDGDYVNQVLSDTGSGTNAAVEAKKKAERQKFAPVVEKFNESPKKGLKLGIDEGLIQDSPDAIAEFLSGGADLNLDLAQIGDLLGEKDDYYQDILQAFIERMDFEGLTFDNALREFLSGFRLPGEAQKIDRFMERFASSYCDVNEGIFPHEDTAYLLAFSLIMLNTDLHNPSIKNKMTKEQFIKNNTGFDSGDMKLEYLENLYDAIKNNEIKMDSDETTAFANSSKSGWVTKRGGRIKTWKKRWLVLSDNCLYYFKKMEEAQDMTKNALGIIPLEDINVREVKQGTGKPYFELYHPKKTEMKAMRIRSGKIDKGHHDTYLIQCETEKDKNEWIASISGAVVKNPFLDLIEKKRREQAEGKSGKSKKKKSKKAEGTVDFTAVHELCNLCSVNYKDSATIKEAYGTHVFVEPPVSGVRFFVLIDAARKRQQVILGGTKWESAKKLKGAVTVANISEHYGLSKTYRRVGERVVKYLKKDYFTFIAGHAIGGVVAMYLGLFLSGKNFKLETITTFGAPKMIPAAEKDKFSKLPIMRICHHQDPLPGLFSGNVHVGGQLLLLSAPFYCYSKKTTPRLEPDPPSKNDIDMHISVNHVVSYLRALEATVQQPSLVSYDNKAKHI